MNHERSPDSLTPDIDALNRDLGDVCEIREHLGTGGMGSVYLGYQPSLERTVAIKILSSDVVGNVERFLAEARVLARCNHPNIVSIYDYGETASGTQFIVMEHVPQGSLADLIEEAPLDNRTTFSLLRQICDGLAYAHSRGLIHLDIKPENILIGEGGEVKIADFGLARMKGSRVGLPAAGTPIYIAPEVKEELPEIDHRADIFGLGVVMYELLTGQKPKGIWKPPSELSSQVDPSLDRVVSYAIKREPQHRYQSVVELESELVEIFLRNPEQQGESDSASGLPIALRLTLVFLAMFLAQIAGSAFNIWYNKKHIIPQFFADAPERFQQAIAVYNGFAYVPLLAIWGFLVFSIRRMDPDSIAAKRRVINLPWWAMGIAAVGWFGCIPGLWLPLRDAGMGYAREISISISIGAAMALTQGFLLVDLAAQKWLYPLVFSRKDKPWTTSRTLPLSSTGRGIFWTVSAGFCPIFALLLLIPGEDRFFAAGVAIVCAIYGLVGAWLLAKMIVSPLQELSKSAHQIGEGDLDTGIEFLRADEFGKLGHEFNHMIYGLRERAHIRSHLGKSHDSAGALLNREEEQSARSCEIVVLALHLEGIHRIHEEWDSESAVALTNQIAEVFETTVERFGSQSTRFSPSSSLAIFSSEKSIDAALSDVATCADFLFQDLEEVISRDGFPLRVGIGIEKGTATLGSHTSGTQRETIYLGQVIPDAIALSEKATPGISISS